MAISTLVGIPVRLRLSPSSERASWQMANWNAPPTDTQAVNKAARELRTYTLPLPAGPEYDLVNRWRSAHSFPLNAMQVDLRRKVRHVEPGSDRIAQRIKRIESIHRKLQKEQTMRLIQMQDIGGCRAVLSSMQAIKDLRERYRAAVFAHTLYKENDYIAKPKLDGYRSLHLVYEFVGAEKTACYDGLRIEVQIRTELQHAWATAVETVDLFTKQAIKSNQGRPEWQRFFALMSGAISAIEGEPSVAGLPTTKAEMLGEIRDLAKSLRVRDTLTAYRSTLQNAKDKNFKFLVLELDIKNRSIKLSRFGPKANKAANVYRDLVESRLTEDDDIQVVLLSVDSLQALYKSYPNYFGDTTRFVVLFDMVVSGNFPDPARS